MRRITRRPLLRCSAVSPRDNNNKVTVRTKKYQRRAPRASYKIFNVLQSEFTPSTRFSSRSELIVEYVGRSCIAALRYSTDSMARYSALSFRVDWHVKIDGTRKKLQKPMRSTFEMRTILKRLSFSVYTYRDETIRNSDFLPSRSAAWITEWHGISASTRVAFVRPRAQSLPNRIVTWSDRR